MKDSVTKSTEINSQCIVDPEFDTLFSENYKAPKEIHFERDIFEILETLN